MLEMEIQNKGWSVPHGARNAQIREIRVGFSASRRNPPEGGTRWQRSRCPWTTRLSTDTSGICLQTHKCLQNPSSELTAVSPWHPRRNLETHARLRRTEERRSGRDKSVSGTGPALGSWGNRSRVPPPNPSGRSPASEQTGSARLLGQLCQHLFCPAVFLYAVFFFFF